jgi:uncharacterized membrane protein
MTARPSIVWAHEGYVINDNIIRELEKNPKQCASAMILNQMQPASGDVRGDVAFRVILVILILHRLGSCAYVISNVGEAVWL